MATLGHALIEKLRNAGCVALSGLPGGGSNGDLVEEAARQGLRFVLTSTESGGGLIAATLGELTESPGACLATLGPGAASLANSLAHAKLDRCPLVALTDDVGIEEASLYEHQVLDQAAFIRPLVKQSIRLGEDTSAEILGRIISSAAAAPAGPVHLSCDAKALGTVLGESSLPCPDPELGARSDRGATAFLGKARYPVALIGLGARSQRTSEAVRRFCRAKNIPVLATYKGKGVFPESDPLAAGIFTNAKIEREFLERADAFVAIGLDPVELLPRPWPYRKPVLYVGTYPVATHHIPAFNQRIGDIAAILAELDAAVHEAAWTQHDIDALIRNRRLRLWKDWPGLSPADIVRATAEAAPDAWVTVDAGAHMFAATELWRSTRPNHLLISNGLATMGFALPAAIAASIAKPEDRVVAFTGDGGLLISLGELRTAARERSRIVVVVFDDQSLSLIRIKQELQKRPTRGVDLGKVHWTAIAEGMGIAGFACSSTMELEAALSAALSVEGPSLIECRIDGSGYANVLSEIR